MIGRFSRDEDNLIIWKIYHHRAAMKQSITDVHVQFWITNTAMDGKGRMTISYPLTAHCMVRNNR